MVVARGTYGEGGGLDFSKTGHRETVVGMWRCI